MPRRKPNSGKQKKEEQKLKRAIKRGDVPAPEKPKNPRHKHRRVQVQGGSRLTSQEGAARSAALSSKRLASAFAKLSPEFLAQAKERASNDPLPRPLTPASSLFPQLDNAEASLTCPKRPKWRFDMEKKEVERNEEGLFIKWLAETDAIIERWRAPPQPPSESADDDNSEDGEKPEPPIEKAPTYFERNLEVWRQLWRVIESSEILLVLLDCRCPPVHYPQSFHTYLRALKPPRKIILALTKVDVAGQARANAWEAWLKQHYDDVQVVQSSSYREVDQTGQVQGRTREPFLPRQYREDLYTALKKAHMELCEPSDVLKDEPEKLKKWTPRVKTDIDWSADARSTASVSEPSDAPEQDELPIAEDSAGFIAPKYLTIGLIGQPNVGKSSLLNALFGHHKVKASRTPGKV
jgi:ribosome biogenesis GTPase A